MSDATKSSHLPMRIERPKTDTDNRSESRAPASAPPHVAERARPTELEFRRGQRPRTGSPSLLRQINLAAVLSTIRASGPLSRRDVARATGLSRPTVDEVLTDLLESGYVEEAIADDEQARHRPGPKARIINFRANQGHVAGIDIGANKILVLIADLNGATVGSARAALPEDAGQNLESVIGKVRSLVRDALAAASLTDEALKAIGVSTPGVIEPASGRITLAPQIPHWEGLELRPLLEPFLPEPIIIDNETLLSLVAERWRGSAQHVNHALYIQIGYCIGAAILADGQVYRGAVSAAGEIGYLPLFLDQPSPTDGRGAFEYAAGGDAFSRLGRELVSSGRGEGILAASGGESASIDAEVIFRCAEQGDPEAIELVEQLVGRLALGLAAGVVLLNPELVIVGGGVSRAGDALLAPLRTHVDRMVPVSSPIVLSALGDEAAALGAVRAAMDAADDVLFGFSTLRQSSFPTALGQ